MQRTRFDSPKIPFDIYIYTPNNDASESSDKDIEATRTVENNLDYQKASNTTSITDQLNSNTNSGDTNKIFSPKIESMAMLASMLSTETFETGISNPSEKYFIELIKKDRDAALNGINKLFMDNYSTNLHQTNILVGILHILSHLSYTDVYPIGQTIAICAFSHKNSEVEEFGIKCFENWEHKDGINKLKAIKFNSKWLQEYAEDVIKELSEVD